MQAVHTTNPFVVVVHPPVVSLSQIYNRIHGGLQIVLTVGCACGNGFAVIVESRQFARFSKFVVSTIGRFVKGDLISVDSFAEGGVFQVAVGARW